MVHLILFILGQIASADEQHIATGWYFYDVGDHRAAMALSKDILQKNPNNLAAHNLHIAARKKIDPLFSSHLYQVLVDENPDEAALDIALAMALVREGNTVGVSELLHLDSEIPEYKYWSLRFEERRRRITEEDTAAVQEQLIAFGVEHTFAKYHRLRELFPQQEACSKELQTEFEEYIAEHPWHLQVATRLWRGKPNKCQKDIQRSAISLAKKQIKSENPVEVYAALQVLQSGEKEKLISKAQERLIEIDPERKDLFEEEVSDEIYNLIYDADARPTHELAIAALQKISKDIPKKGPARAAYESVLQSRYEAMGNIEEAVKMAYRATLNDPDNASLLNDFAYEASKNKMMLKEALAASDRSIELLKQKSFDGLNGQTYSSWLANQNYSLSAYLDTRAWVYYQQGEYQKAREDLENALRLTPSEAVHKAHLGFVLCELGEEKLALQIFLEALNTGIFEAQLAKDSEAKVAELFPQFSDVWFPNSFDEYWLAVQASQNQDDGEEDEPEESQHPMIGQQIPIDSFELIRGEFNETSQFEGQLLVIDLWATWCGPCIKGMPHLQEVAAEYKDKGVNIIGLSVDQEKQAPEEFFVDFPAPAYTVGWIGEEGFEAFNIRGIPSLFVVDNNGVIIEYFSGYSPGSTRLEDTIDRLLQ